MKAHAILFATPLLFLAACSQNDASGEKKILSVEKKEVLKEPVKVFPNQTMTVKVKGMSCEHSCGGSIRMALKETGAVDRCSFDFKEERPENTAIITYDDKKISPKKIISIIESINDKQFTTADPTVKPITAARKVDEKPNAEKSSSRETSFVAPKESEEENIATFSGGSDYSGVVNLFTYILTID